jgi:Ca2+-transporting ATPase
MENWHAAKKEVIFEELRSSEEGLSQKEAGLRLKKNGKNIIKPEDKLSGFKIFFLQFKSWLVYILLFSIAISVFIKHYLDSGVITVIVLLNATVGFVQQYKAEKSIKELKKLLVQKTKVLRDNKLKVISTEEIVVGDVVILKQGDKVPADCRIFRYENLDVDESILTGESLSVQKEDKILNKNTILAERVNMLYAGTNIERGNCRVVVVSVGMDTEFGKVAGMLETIKEENTPMQRKIDKFAKNISFFIIGLIVILFIIGVKSGYETYEMLLTSIAVAISAIPEGLPAVMTMGLAFASKKMSYRKVIIKRLSAAESLGSVSVICTDKTGTITEGKMKVVQVYCSGRNFIKEENSLSLNGKAVNVKKDSDLFQLIKTSVLCNNARLEKEKNKELEVIGDPTESSLVLNSFELGFNKKLLTEEEKRIKEFPFSSERKMMSIIRKNSKNIVYSKGAPEIILKHCNFELLNGNKIQLTDSKREQLIKETEKMQQNALRVLGFAFKIYNRKEEDVENNLTFIGLIGMKDPPRKEVKNAIELCKKAGIKVKMVTGDSGITARAIANQVGIFGDMIDGKRLNSMTDEELISKMNSINIFSRTESNQKLRIVTLLKQMNEEVAVTGDGVNDAPALKKSDIGVAMGIRGSDVSREVADMILLNDNFASIVNAIEEGRIVYDNIKKVTKFLLAINFSELLLIAFTIFLNLPLPILPLQLLWMNLVTDSIPAIAITKEKGEEVMAKKPKKEKSILEGILLFLVIAGIITFVSELAIFLLSLNKYDISQVRTMVVTGDILFELLFVFICRNHKIFGKDGALSNKLVFYGVLLSIIAHVAVLYTSASKFFEFTPLTLNQWLLILPFSFSGIVLFGVGRWIIKKTKKKNKEKG